MIARLIPSLAALVTPVVIAARIWGHQVETVVARRCISGRPLAAADARGGVVPQRRVCCGHRSSHLFGVRRWRCGVEVAQ